jgi:hypothetical protein
VREGRVGLFFEWSDVGGDCQCTRDMQFTACTAHPTVRGRLQETDSVIGLCDGSHRTGLAIVGGLLLAMSCIMIVRVVTRWREAVSQFILVSR